MIFSFIDKALVALPKTINNMCGKLPFLVKCALPGGVAKREVKEEFNRYLVNEIGMRRFSNLIGLSGTTIGPGGRFEINFGETVTRSVPTTIGKMWCVYISNHPSATGITLDYAMGFAKSSLPTGDDRVNEGIPAILAICETPGTEKDTEFGALCISGEFEATAIPVPDLIAKKAQMAEHGSKGVLTAVALAAGMITLGLEAKSKLNTTCPQEIK